MPAKITQRAIAAALRRAKEADRVVYLYDTELRGLGCRCSPKGRASWFVERWQGGRGGRAQRVVIGHYPAWDADKARKEASTPLGEVTKGIDLVDRKERQRRAKREALQAPKLSDTVSLYLARKSKPGSYWTEVKRKFDVDVIPSLGKDTRVTEITKQEIRTLIDAKEAKGQHGAARYLFATLRPFFKFCVERDMIASSPLDALSSPTPLEARDRVLTDDEIKTFWSATESDPLFGPFYRLLLLTGQRREEVGAMQWREIDTEAGTWTIPKDRTKNGREHVVHLSPQALAILEKLPKRDSGYVFTTTLDTPISGYGKAKARLDALMPGIPAWRVHDLRRTAASGMARLGFEPHVIERVLNHVSGAQGGLVGVYQRYDYLPERKAALAAWGGYISGICKTNNA